VDEEVRVLARAQAEQLDDFALELEDGYAGTIEVDAAQLLGSLEMEYYIGSHAARCGGGMAEVVCPGGGEATKIWHGGWGGTMGEGGSLQVTDKALIIALYLCGRA